jgi:hypothetical protein
MKRISLLCVFFVAVSLVKAQSEKQIMLSDKVSLKNELADNYKRILLSPDEIKLADSLVAKYMLDNHEKYAWTKRVDNYAEYYRQYAGYIAGSKMVFINAFRHKPGTVTDEFLHETLVSARGGGSSFFTIKVNIQSMVCSELRVNAPK